MYLSARHSKGDSQLPDADSVVVRVPEKVLLSLRTAEGFPKFEEAVRAVGSQLEERAVLSALILWLSTKNSQGFSSWAPYLKVLPKDYTILGAFPKDLEDEFQARLLSPPPQLSDRCLINTLLPGAPAMRALRASEQLAGNTCNSGMPSNTSVYARGPHSRTAAPSMPTTSCKVQIMVSMDLCSRCSGNSDNALSRISCGLPDSFRRHAQLPSTSCTRATKLSFGSK